MNTSGTLPGAMVRTLLRVQRTAEEDGVVEGFDIEPIPRPSFAPRRTFEISQSMLSCNYYGWSDDTYMHILPKGHDGAQINIMSTLMEEGNVIAYTMNMVATNNRVGIPPRVPDYSSSDIRIAIWNCRGIARASFLPNLRGLLAVTRAAVIVVTNIRVGYDNAREILRRTGIDHGFTTPIRFVGGVCIFWELSKVFLVPHKFEVKHATFVVKVSVDNFVDVTYDTRNCHCMRAYTQTLHLYYCCCEFV